jgi:hypothetical protein
MWRLLDNIDEIAPSHFQVGMLTPFPGTALYQEVRDQIFVDDWSYYDLMHVTHFHPKMDPITMQRTWLKAQKEMWSLRSLGKRYKTVFSPPINKLFYWVLTRFADAEFAEFLEFLESVTPAPRLAPSSDPGQPQRRTTRLRGPWPWRAPTRRRRATLRAWRSGRAGR